MTGMPIRPGPGRIAIQEISGSNEYHVPGTEVKLWIANPSSHEGMIGKVVAVCAGYQSDSGAKFDPNYSVGDIVVIGKYTGTKLNIGRETFTILFEKDVLASVEVEDA